MAADAPVERVSARFAASGLTAQGSTLDGDPTVLSALVEFSTGVTGLIGQSGGWDVVLACSNGSITVESDGDCIRCRHPEGEDVYWRASHLDNGGQGRWQRGGGTQLALDRLVSSLRGDTLDQTALDKKAMLTSQRLLFACAQSYLADGVVVDPRYLDPDLVVTGRTGQRYA
jgi:hypothetical protein